MESEEIGLAVNIYSEATITNIFPVWAIVVIVIAVVVVLAIIGYCIYKWRKKQLKNNRHGSVTRFLKKDQPPSEVLLSNQSNQPNRNNRYRADDD